MVEMKMRKTAWTVKPGEKSPRRSITLTLLDRLFAFPHYPSTIWIYRKTNDTTVDAAALRESLSKTLVHFYPMAGRYRLDGAGILEIDCNDADIPFVVAETDSELKHLGDFAPTPDMSVFLPTIDDTNNDISSYPLFAIQVTYFKCGGVALGLSLEHHAGDGSSIFHLINSWSEISRGVGISVAPFLDRVALLRPRDPPRPMSNHPGFSLFSSIDKRSHKKNHVLKVSVFRLTKDQVDKLKAMAAKHGDCYTTFEVLTGHIWKCVCKVRGLGNEEKTMMAFPMNARFNRWKPELPPGFFGNALLPAVVAARVGDLDSKPLSHIAAEIRKVSIQMDTEYFRSTVDLLSLLPAFSSLGEKNTVFEAEPNFSLIGWAKIGLNDADFGWGPPIYSGPATNFCFERAYIIPSDHCGRGLSVAIALRLEHMDLFEKLFYAFESKTNETDSLTSKL